MVRSTNLRRAARVFAIVLAGAALLVMPALAAASAVELGTTKPFVVLAGSTVTNTGPSVLNGELGLYPGTAITGFGAPAVVNGATHATDAVARIAKDDLTTAYNVAAGQPVAPSADLSGTDLGNRTLLAGAYRFTSSAQLTGPLTLNAQGDPNAQFVFEIASALTTASASSVVLTNGADPCRVFWQVGSSATLGTTTAFQGNLMALSSISLKNGATVVGRMLARNGAVTLINNVLNGAVCGAATSTPVTPGTPGGVPGAPGTPGTPATPGTPGTPGAPGTPATPTPRPATHRGTSAFRHTAREDCTDGFTASVRGAHIAGVVFRLDGRRIASLTSPPFRKYIVTSAPGHHTVTARATFTDRTRARTMHFRYVICAAGSLAPRRAPSSFTG
jgi:hypothetical protein